MSSEKTKVFVDSSILIEFRKQSKVDLPYALFTDVRLQLVINPIVLSEFTYHLLAIEAGKSPRSIKEKAEIGLFLEKDYPYAFLSIFRVLSGGDDIVPVFLNYMKQYNLLPNDALILAYCKVNNIDALASYDSRDFEQACKTEDIFLIQNKQDLASFLLL